MDDIKYYRRDTKSGEEKITRDKFSNSFDANIQSLVKTI